MDHGKLAGHGEDSTLGRGVRELRRGRTDLADERGDVDDRAADAEALLGVGLVLPSAWAGLKQE